MSERYTKVFSLTENLYSKNSPVVISAGALLKDNVKDSVLAQLKIKNISDKVIKAVRVSVTSYDVKGSLLDEKVQHEYLDLTTARDNEFGQKSPILLNNNSARSFTLCVNEVIFSDGSIWNYDGEELKSLAAVEDISDMFDNFNIAKQKNIIQQYKLDYGSSCNYKVTTDRDLWICTCGHINHKGEEKCPLCNNSLEALKNIDLKSLEEKAEIRLKQSIQQSKKNKKIIIISALVALLVLISLISFSSYSNKNAMYKEAVETYDFELAIEYFDSLGSFKDSEEKLKETKYNYAINLIEEKYEENYFEKAKEIFTSLGSYQDSEAKLLWIQVLETLAESSSYQYGYGSSYQALTSYREDMLNNFNKAKKLFDDFDGELSEKTTLLYKQIKLAINYFGDWKFVSGNQSVAFGYTSSAKFSLLSFGVDYYDDSKIYIYALPHSTTIAGNVYFGCEFSATTDENEPFECVGDNGNTFKVSKIKNNKITITEYEDGKAINKLTLKRAN